MQSSSRRRLSCSIGSDGPSQYRHALLHLAARGLHPDRSLAEHYHPLAMDPALLKAHGALDRAVDTALGAAKKLTTEEQRLEVLFRNYQTLTS